jgi:acylphosphatase
MTARDDRAGARLVVRGRVQGVWFRGAMQEEARRLGVVGWVRNADDGSVEAECAGARAAVEALVAWAHRGPPAARVQRVDVTWMEVGGGTADFVVRR